MTYSQQQNPDWRIKESILYCIGTITDLINKHKDLKKMVEPMLSTHVIQEFQSPLAPMRSRACWIYGEFGHYKFKDNNHVLQVVNYLFNLMKDESLVVRFQAACSITKFLDRDVAIEALRPALKDLFTLYLGIIREIDSEELINALEGMVEHYQDDIEPFAIELIENMVENYRRLTQ